MEIQLSVLFLAILLVLVSWSFTYSKHNKEAAIKYWPLLGNLPSLVWNANRLPEWFTEVFLSSGKGTFRIDTLFSNLNYIVTCHPQNLEYILKTNFSNFPKGSSYNERFDILGDGILNADNESWKLQRKMAHGCLSTAAFRNHVTTSTRKVVEDQLVPFLAFMAETGRIVDLQEMCKRFAFDISIGTILGGDEKYLSTNFPDNEFAVGIKNAEEAIIYRHALPMFMWKFMRWLRVGRERKLAETWIMSDVFMQNYISKRRAEVLNGSESCDVLSSYIKSGDVLDDQFLRDTVLSLFVAGHDTIGSGLVWFLWSTAKTPHVEAKLLDELKVICMKNNKYDHNKKPMVFDSDDLKDLVYLHAAICESLRLYPSVPLNSKGVKREDVLPDGTKVIPGMQILLSFYSEGIMPWVWGDDSAEFKPERWIDDEGKLKREPLSKFFAFNAGARSCLGKDLSFTQMKAAIAAILFNFQVELLPGYPVRSKPSITLRMEYELLVKIKERCL